MTGPLRHRATPIDAIDSVTHLAADEVAGVKHIRGDDPYLEGHYPGFTIYPGVFILESACRLVEEYVRETVAGDARAELARVRSMRFLAPLMPGDTLRVRCAIVGGDDERTDVKATCLNAADEKVAQMSLELRVVPGDREARDG